jgi:hypothetical protein
MPGRRLRLGGAAGGCGSGMSILTDHPAATVPGRTVSGAVNGPFHGKVKDRQSKAVERAGAPRAARG